MSVSRGVLLGLAAILAVYLYGECRARQGAADERTAQHFRSVDSSAAVTDSLLNALYDSLRASYQDLRRLGVRDSAQRREITRLRNAVVRGDALPHFADTTLFQVAVRDSIIARQDSVIAGLDQQLGLYRAMVAAQDTILSRLVSEREAFRGLARDFQRKANRRIHCGAGPGATVGLNGKAAAGVTVACIVRL